MPSAARAPDGRWPSSERLLVAALALFAYLAIGALAPPMDNSTGEGENWMFVATLWFILITSAGWLLGRRAGVLFGIALSPLQILVNLAIGRGAFAGASGAETHWALFFNVVFALFAGALGDYSRDARERSKELAAKNAKLEDATAALARSESMFRMFAERVGHGVWIASSANGERYVNPAAREFYGDDPNLWISRFHPDDRRAAEAASAKLAEGIPQDIEHRVSRLDGGYRWVRAQSFPVLDNSGRIASFVGIVEDVTERKEREMRRELIERRERLSSLGRLVAGVAHEVNNPLTYLAGNMQLAYGKVLALTPVEHDRAGVERIGRLLVTSIEGAERIARIVKALRSVTRAPIEGGSEIVRLNAIASNVHELMRTSVPATLDLRLDLDPEDPTVLGSGAELHQVLLNLATNAVQAVGARRGRVTIETRVTAGDAQIIVKDDGPGISEDARSRLFTPFFTTKPEGTGLGLNIAHAIARDHGGDIEVESRPAGGALFRVRLPAAVPQLVEVTT